MHWTAKLSGDQAALARLEQFDCSHFKLSRRGADWLFNAPAMDATDSAEAARTLAISLVSKLSALLALNNTDSAGIEVDGIESPRGTGNDVWVFPQTAVLKLRGFPPEVVITRPDGATERHKPDGDIEALVPLALEDPLVERVLEFTRRGDWASLYKALEVMEIALGGEKALQAKEWARKAEINLFTHTANNVRALGLDARHANPNWTPPPNPMSLKEAQRLLRTMVMSWLKDKNTP